MGGGQANGAEDVRGRTKFRAAMKRQTARKLIYAKHSISSSRSATMRRWRKLQPLLATAAMMTTTDSFQGFLCRAEIIRPPHWRRLARTTRTTTPPLRTGTPAEMNEDSRRPMVIDDESADNLTRRRKKFWPKNTVTISKPTTILKVNQMMSKTINVWAALRI